jgi:hypothetical protein
MLDELLGRAELKARIDELEAEVESLRGQLEGERERRRDAQQTQPDGGDEPGGQVAGPPGVDAPPLEHVQVGVDVVSYLVGERLAVPDPALVGPAGERLPR